MGILDIFKSNKIQEPIFYNQHEDTRLNVLDELIDKVSDDKKQLLIDEKNYVQIGLTGEKNVIYELQHCKNPIIFLHDVTIDNGFHSSQIDFIVITKKGIIVLETKKLIGDITIDNEGNFVRYFKNSKGEVYKKEGIYSPLTQNKYHVDALNNLFKVNKFKTKVPIYSLVVIANSKTIINKRYAKSHIQKQVIKYDQLNSYIDEILQVDYFSLSDSKMFEIADLINNNDTKKSIDYISKFNIEINEDNINNEILVIDENNKEDYSSNDELYEKLKVYRYNKSKELNIPAYEIFTNKVLEQIVLNKPTTKDLFLISTGYNENKYNIYGLEIMKIINPSYEEEIKVKNKLDDSQIEILRKRLKQYRFNKAKELNYEPYYIFNNFVLDEILDKLPTNKDELLNIKGIGNIKVELYGMDILNIINDVIKK